MVDRRGASRRGREWLALDRGDDRPQPAYRRSGVRSGRAVARSPTRQQSHRVVACQARMRLSRRLPDADEISRLTERIPAKPISGDGTVTATPLPSDDGRGRYRNETQRDRDRILYSSAFQRLGGVTQVSESEPGHTFHTRLTHSLKVAQIARRCAEARRDVAEGHITGAAATLIEHTLDPDAAEAAALGHDLGHPPFGHVAEETLKTCSAASFEGNAQNFRIVTRLAIREPCPVSASPVKRSMAFSSTRGSETS